MVKLQQSDGEVAQAAGVTSRRDRAAAQLGRERPCARVPHAALA